MVCFCCAVWAAVSVLVQGHVGSSVLVLSRVCSSVRVQGHVGRNALQLSMWATGQQCAWAALAHCLIESPGAGYAACFVCTQGEGLLLG